MLKNANINNQEQYTLTFKARLYTVKKINIESIILKR
jgi:hypothetical protein